MNAFNQKFKFKKILIALFLILIFTVIYGFIWRTSKEKKHIYAQSGFLDLSALDFSEDNTVYLGGEWEFYYNKFINPAGIEDSHDGYIVVPELWNSFIYDEESIGSYGYGSYRLKVKINDNQEILGMKLPSMSSSYKLYINGKLINQSGIPGTSKDTEIPEWKPDIIFFVPDSEELDIIVHVSNFHFAKGGMWGNILFGNNDSIIKYREVSLMRSYLLLGLLSIAAIFMLLLSLIEKNFPCLYLALFCLSCTLRELTVREVALWNIFGYIGHNMLAKLEYVTMPLITLFYTMFIYNLYKNEFNKKIYSGIVLITTALILLTLMTEPIMFSKFLIVYQIVVLMSFIYSAYIIAKIFIRKKRSSGIILTGIIIMLLAIINDILYVEKINTNYGMAHAYTIAFSIFLMSQIYTVFFNIRDNYYKANQVARSQLMLLYNQIKPHFLFNILNTIQELIDERPDKSKKLLNVLSDYIRGNFKYSFNSDISLITLKEEIELLESFVYMANTRFDDRIELKLDIEDICLENKIPAFIIQPLVENSIKHGMEEGRLTITISAKVSRRNLIIIVKDDGVGISKTHLYNLFNNKSEYETNAIGSGIGLQNIIMRMRLLYNSDIKINSQKGLGTEVILAIPIGN
jgi:two-component system LytT family sensor kinase